VDAVLSKCDCVDDKMKGYLNCPVLYGVPQNYVNSDIYTHICLVIVYKCWFSFCEFFAYFS